MRFDAMKWKVAIPWTMVSARAALAPLMVLGAACRWNGLTMAGMVVVALLSDFFDGVLARRWGTDTAGLRLSDSMADTLFYLCVAGALTIGQAGIWRSNGALLMAVLGLEACRFALDFAKFGKPVSYHSYLAKTWGLVLATAVIATFVQGHVGLLMTGALVLGIVCLLEGITMSVILPVWSRDIKTLAAAVRVRRQHRTQGTRAGASVRRDVAIVGCGGEVH